MWVTIALTVIVTLSFFNVLFFLFNMKLKQNIILEGRGYTLIEVHFNNSEEVVRGYCLRIDFKSLNSKFPSQSLRVHTSNSTKHVNMSDVQYVTDVTKPMKIVLMTLGGNFFENTN